MSSKWEDAKAKRAYKRRNVKAQPVSGISFEESLKIVHRIPLVVALALSGIGR